MVNPLETSSNWEFRLSELLSLSVPVQWAEAVAVVRRVALAADGTWSAAVSAFVSQPQGEVEGAGLFWPPPDAELAAPEYIDTIHGIPDPSGIWLQADGTIRLEVATGTPEQTLTRLRVLLVALLPASTPPDLRTLAEPRNSTARTAQSIKEFLEQLTYFARPDDFEEIRALVARVLEARLSADRVRCIQTLTDRARHTTPLDSSIVDNAGKPLTVRRLVMVGGCAAAVLVLVAGLWMLGRPSAGSPVGPMNALAIPPSAARRMQDIPVAGAAHVTNKLSGGVKPFGVRRGGDLRLPATVRSRTNRRALRPTFAEPVSSLDGTAESARPFEWRGGTGVPQHRELSATTGLTDALAPPAFGVYSSVHPDVVAPTLIRAQMPQVPIAGVPIARLGALEMLVGDDGAVVSARLVPTSTRYQDRMMVSAAKTWRFAPARRYGQPVRYRLQMPITW